MRHVYCFARTPATRDQFPLWCKSCLSFSLLFSRHFSVYPQQRGHSFHPVVEASLSRWSFDRPTVTKPRMLRTRGGERGELSWPCAKFSTARLTEQILRAFFSLRKLSSRGISPVGYSTIVFSLSPRSDECPGTAAANRRDTLIVVNPRRALSPPRASNSPSPSGVVSL